MTDRAILDTDILSELLRNRNVRVNQNAAAYRQEFGQFTISTLSVLEIVKGLVKADREAKIAPFLRFASYHDVVTLDVPTAELAGRIYARLELQGLTIGRIDPMIAGVAIRNGLSLVTGNTAHYERVRKLGLCA